MWGFVFSPVTVIGFDIFGVFVFIGNWYLGNVREKRKEVKSP